MHLYGLIGYPLGHSFSKKYFTDKFERENLDDCFFELFPLENISDFPSVRPAIKNLEGLAVTIPYKQSIIPYLNLLDDEAKIIGAVNCIQFSNGFLKGYNTDVIGFERSLSPLLQPHHTKALVLGTGGASLAVQYVLRKMAIAFLVVTRQPITETGKINYTDIDKKLLQEYPLIINCTAVGMSPNENDQPKIPYEHVGKENLLYDLIYSPLQTNFLRMGLEKGAAIKNGYEMLIIQAEENWRIWNENAS